MQQVGDDLRSLRVGQRRTGHAGIPVVQAGHRVEQVREARGAGLQRGHPVFVAARRVPDLDHEAERAQGDDEFQVPRHFGGQRDQLQRGQGVQRQHLGQRGGGREVGLRAQAAGVEVGPFQVHAQHARPAGRALRDVRRQGAQGGFDVGSRRGHRGGQQRRGAVAGMHACNGRDGVAAGHGVVAAAAVHVQVDEPRQQHWQPAAQDLGLGHWQTDGGADAAVHLRQFAAEPALGREDVALQRQPRRGGHRQGPSGRFGSSSVGASAGTRKRSVAHPPKSALRQRSLQNGRQGLAGPYSAG